MRDGEEFLSPINFAIYIVTYLMIFQSFPGPSSADSGYPICHYLYFWRIYYYSLLRPAATAAAAVVAALVGC